MVGRLHVIVDVKPGIDAMTVLGGAIDGGAPLVQLRVKGLDDSAHYELALDVVRRCRASGVVCVINDRVDIALATSANGVHVGLDDLPVAEVRRMMGASALVGATARDPETARKHQFDGASYIGAGPAFPTSSKPGLPEPIGLETLARVVSAVDIPTIAVGGITADRISSIRETGCHGVAVISAVAKATDPRAATAELLDALSEVPA